MKTAGNEKKSIVVSGYYGYRNMGDDAILEMICRDLGGAFDLTVLSGSPEETERLYPVKAVDRYDLPRVLQAVRKADLLLSGGGSLLQDKTSSRSLLYYLAVLRAASLCGVPSAVYASGLGPILSPGSRRRTGRALRDVSLIGLRDEASAALLEELCPGKGCLLTADPVFHMEPAPESAALAILRENGLESGELFAVALRRTGEEQGRRLAALLDAAAAAGCGTPVFLCMQDPGDYEAARAVQRMMKSPACVLEGCRSGPEAIALLAKTRGVVSMRLHALIFGAVAGVPTLAFNVDPKMEALARALHAPEPVDPDSFDPAETARLLARYFARGEAPDCGELRERSLRMPAAVKELLERGGR